MTRVIDFLGRRRAAAPSPGPLLDDYSLEVTPRTAAKVASFAAILPAGTRVYVAHIDGTPAADMTAAVARLAHEGMAPVPHLPARAIGGRAELADLLTRYRTAGARRALLIGGGLARPKGDYHCAMQLLETGLLEANGFEAVSVAGHPEGNRDIDPDGDAILMQALADKQAWAQRTGTEMAIATQFAFEAAPIIAWSDRLRAAGIRLPVHIGVAGPAKLQTLIRYALTCGVGPSVKVLQKRAADVTRLLLPFTPEALLRDLAAHRAAHPDFAVTRVHFFPLGGIEATTDFTARLRARRPRVAASA